MSRLSVTHVEGDDSVWGLPAGSPVVIIPARIAQRSRSLIDPKEDRWFPSDSDPTNASDSDSDSDSDSNSDSDIDRESDNDSNSDSHSSSTNKIEARWRNRRQQLDIYC